MNKRNKRAWIRKFIRDKHTRECIVVDTWILIFLTFLSKKTYLANKFQQRLPRENVYNKVRLYYFCTKEMKINAIIYRSPFALRYYIKSIRLSEKITFLITFSFPEVTNNQRFAVPHVFELAFAHYPARNV